MRNRTSRDTNRTSSAFFSRSDQSIQEIQHIEIRLGGGFGRFESESSGKDRQGSEQRPFGFVEQVEAPVEDRLQRLMARESGASAAADEIEATLEPGRQGFEGQGFETSGAQFDGQRDPVEVPADAGNCLDVPCVDVESGSGVRTAVGKEPDRLVSQELVGGGAGRRKFERRNWPPLFAVHPQPFPGGSQQCEPRSCSQSSITALLPGSSEIRFLCCY